MKALIATGGGRLALSEIPDCPAPVAGTVNIRVLAAGICGSDLHIWHGTNPFATYPRVLGHEIVGEITAVGEGVSGLEAGQRVIVNQLRSCGECWACKTGRPNVCPKLQVVGVHIDGGFCEAMQLPADRAVPLPETLAHTDAVMIEPLSIAVQGCWRAGLTAEDTLLVLGAGALGSSVIRVAANIGAKIIAADISDEKLKVAIANGASHTVNTQEQNLKEALAALTGGYGPTAAIDAACFSGSLALLVDVIGNAGRVVTMGFATETESISPVALTGREIEIRGSRLHSEKFPEVIGLVKSGKLSVDGLVSHVYPFSKAVEAMELAASGQPGIRKVVLDMTLE